MGVGVGVFRCGCGRARGGWRGCVGVDGARFACPVNEHDQAKEASVTAEERVGDSDAETALAALAGKSDIDLEETDVQEISRTRCRICREKGRWARECPNKGKQVVTLGKE